jgi:hypothetical protein
MRIGKEGKQLVFDGSDTIIVVKPGGIGLHIDNIRFKSPLTIKNFTIIGSEISNKRYNSINFYLHTSDFVFKTMILARKIEKFYNKLFNIVDYHFADKSVGIKL